MNDNADVKRVIVRKWREFNNEWAVWCPCCSDSSWPVYALSDHRRALTLAIHHANEHEGTP